MAERKEDEAGPSRVINLKSNDEVQHADVQHKDEGFDID